jgi:hypothetical protein
VHGSTCRLSEDPLELLQQLTNQVKGLRLRNGTERSLLAVLSAAARSLRSPNVADDASAIGALQAFINHVTNVPVLVDVHGVPVSDTERSELVAAAEDIIDLITL